MDANGISACIIARDEEELLPACLESLRPWVDELCLLDTGSTDRTVAIAQQHGAHVAPFAWRDDFSAARNASLALATRAWILVVDADERLDGETGPALRRACEDPDARAFLVDRDDREGGGRTERLALPRLFRNDPRIRFHRPVHESVMESLFALGVRALPSSGARLIHLGYLPEVLAKRDKRARNLAILRRQFLEQPDDLYAAYKLAATLPPSSEPALQADRLRAFAAADALASKLSATARAELPFLPRLFDAHAAALHETGQLTRAIAVAERGLVLFPEFAELLYRRGELARCAGDTAAAPGLLQRALAPRAASTVRADRPRELAVRCQVSLLALDAPLTLDTPLLAPAASLGEPAAPELLVRCARAHRDLRAGQLDAAARALGPLLSSDGRDENVKLLAARLAWALGDRSTAQTLWGSLQSDLAHRAAPWLALLELLQGHPPRSFVPREIDEAALARLLARLAGRELALDPAFRAEALASATRRWCEELRLSGRGDLATRAGQASSAH